MRQALWTTLQNRPFLIYLFAQIIFILGITMTGPAVPYFARVILGQLIDLDRAKWVYAASAAIMSYLLSAHGRSAEEPLGVLLIGPVAGSFCLVASVLYAFYPERDVQAEANAISVSTAD